jgi:tetratricopeptide (TPR) repeat protein
LCFFKKTPKGAYCSLMKFQSLLSYLFIFSLSAFCLCSDSFGQVANDDSDLRNSYSASLDRPDSIFLHKRSLYIKGINEGNSTLQGKMLLDMGEISFHLGHYSKTLQYYLDAVKIFQKVKRDDLLADSYNKLGTLYYYTFNSFKARSSYNKAMRLYEELNNKKGIAFTLGKIGHLYEKNKQYDSAFVYQKKALTIYLTVKDKKGIARIYENMGSIYEDLVDYSSAANYFRLSLSNYQQGGEELQVIEVINNLGDIYRKTGNYDLALKQSREALKRAKEKDELHQISSAYRDISKTYNLLGQNDSAFYNAEIARTYLMKVYSLETSRQMAFLQALNDDEAKNDKIKALQFERKVNIIVIVATVLISILLLVAGLLLVSRQRTQKKLMEADLKNKEMEEGQLKQEIELKSKELSTHVLHIIQKNHLLENLKVQLVDIINDEKRDQKKQLKHIINQIDQNFNNDNYWNEFSNVFKQLHHSFFENLNQQFPKLTSTDLKLVSLLKMNMDSNDMAAMLAIFQDSLKIARYRLRKKLNLGQGENLGSFIQSI